MSGNRRNRKAKKSRRRGVTGRTWKRIDRHSLAHGDVDPSGLLTIIDPDLGTRNGRRYASARCGCGCNAVVEARIDNLRAGKTSCPTRRRAQKRSYMVKKGHIDKMKLLGTVLSAAARQLPAEAVTAGLEYAQRLLNDTTLQTEVKASFKPDLSARDLKRAGEVAAKYGAAPVTKVVANAVPPEWKPAARRGLVTPPSTSAPRDKLLIDIPYEQTEAGYDALLAYWNEHKQAPPEGFDLKAWYKSLLDGYRFMRQGQACSTPKVHERDQARVEASKTLSGNR